MLFVALMILEQMQLSLKPAKQENIFVSPVQVLLPLIEELHSRNVWTHSGHAQFA